MWFVKYRLNNKCVCNGAKQKQDTVKKLNCTRTVLITVAAMRAGMGLKTIRAVWGCG